MPCDNHCAAGGGSLVSTILSFLEIVSDFFTKIFEYDILPGVSLFTVLLYNLLIVVVFTAFARRG